MAVAVRGSRIRRHYAIVHRTLALHPIADEVPRETAAPHAGNGQPVPRPTARDTATEESPEAIRHLAIVLVRTIDVAGTRALAYVASLGSPCSPVHVSPTHEEADRFSTTGRPGAITCARTVVSPYRALVTPLVHYIGALHRRCPNLTLTVILPEVVVRHPWHRALHGRPAWRLRRALKPLRKIVVTTVPLHLPD